MQFMNQQVLANCTDLRHLFLSQNEIAKVPPKLLEVILIQPLEVYLMDQTVLFKLQSIPILMAPRSKNYDWTLTM